MFGEGKGRQSVARTRGLFKVCGVRVQPVELCQKDPISAETLSREKVELDKVQDKTRQDKRIKYKRTECSRGQNVAEES